MAQTNGYIGTVVSGGPGANYVVSISGLGNVNAVQQQIDADEPIPAGTKTIVIKDGSVYKMCVPVWQDE